MVPKTPGGGVTGQPGTGGGAGGHPAASKRCPPGSLTETLRLEKSLKIIGSDRLSPRRREFSAVFSAGFILCRFKSTG